MDKGMDKKDSDIYEQNKTFLSIYILEKSKYNQDNFIGAMEIQKEKKKRKGINV